MLGAFVNRLVGLTIFAKLLSQVRDKSTVVWALMVSHSYVLRLQVWIFRSHGGITYRIHFFFLIVSIRIQRRFLYLTSC